MMRSRAAIKAVAKWEAEQYRRAHDAAGAEPMDEKTFAHLELLLEETMIRGFEHPSVQQICEAPNLDWPIETTDQLNPDELNLREPFVQELHFPMLTIDLRWWPDRVEARLEGEQTWEVIVQRPPLSVFESDFALFGEDGEACSPEP